MKPLKTLLIASVATVFFSCGNSQQATTARVNNTPDTQGTIREVADMDDNSWNNETNKTVSTSTDKKIAMNNSSSDSDSKTRSVSSAKMDQQNNVSTTVATRTMSDNEIEVYWIGLKKKDMKSMYEYVNMSQDQILKYQRGYVDYIDSMQNKNKRLTIDQKDLLKQRDGILYDILKTAQYDKYQEWKKKNSNY